MGFPRGLGLTCQLPLLWAHFASSQDHGNAAEVAIGDTHKEGEDAGPGRVAKGGPSIGVDTHDEEGDEDHTETGVDEEVGSSPVIGQGSQDLQRGVETMGMVRTWGGQRDAQNGAQQGDEVVERPTAAGGHQHGVEMTLGGAPSGFGRGHKKEPIALMLASLLPCPRSRRG